MNRLKVVDAWESNEKAREEFEQMELSTLKPTLI